MRIQNNIAALNTLRHSANHQARVGESIRKLSSGRELNRSSDAPNLLLGVAQLRSQVVGLKQTKENVETSVSLLQIAESGLGEVSKILTEIRQRVVHAANEAVNDESMLNADQMEIEHLLKALDQIAQNTTYTEQRLLDGSMGINGVAVGESALDFVSAKAETPASPEEGYQVDITRVSTRARVEGYKPLTLASASDGVEIVVSFDDRTFLFNTDDHELGKEIQDLRAKHDRDPANYPKAQVDQEVRDLLVYHVSRALQRDNLPMEFFERPDHIFVFRHKNFGDDVFFTASSNIDGLLTRKAHEPENAILGKDVEGTIGEASALGIGQELTAREGLPGSQLTVRYGKTVDYVEQPILNEQGEQIGATYVLDSPSKSVAEKVEGFVHLSQQSKRFHLDSNEHVYEPFAFMNVRASKLARHLPNESGFASLADIDVATPQGVSDANLLLEQAIEDVSQIRMELGSFQKHTIERTMSNLGVAVENITEGQSAIEDADMAAKISDMASGQILAASSQAVLAHANQKPQAVLNLLHSS